MSKYIRFEEIPMKGIKTKLYAVINISGNFRLGKIKWYGRWRQYCFFPIGDTIWNRDCLKEIIDFIQELMDERKKVKISAKKY